MDMGTVRQALDYDPATGVFLWRAVQRRPLVGKRAGWMHRNGYWSIRVGGKNYLAHRLAWLHHYGEWPTTSLDHINRDRTDNRIANLREASIAENQRNRVGIGYRMENGRWRARIGNAGKILHIGIFDTESEARAAYEQAKRDLHPEAGL
jgi:hypothetical protein